jgi:hypothetical protein
MTEATAPLAALKASASFLAAAGRKPRDNPARAGQSYGFNTAASARRRGIPRCDRGVSLRRRPNAVATQQHRERQ